MTRSRSEIEEGLQKKEFRLRATNKTASKKSKDHRYYDLWIDDQLTGISTHVSTGSKYKELGKPLLGKMARQVKLSSNDFQRLINCPLDIDEYQEILKGAGVLPQ